LGDVILMTSMIESLAHYHEGEAEIHALVRAENAMVLSNNPHLAKVHSFEKRRKKYHNLRKTVQSIRQERFHVVFNCHRFASSGYVAVRSGAGVKIGFDKNPLSFGYTDVVKHTYGDDLHELDRNHALLQKGWADVSRKPPRLYPSPEDYEYVKEHSDPPFYVLAPASVWHTKQYPREGWLDLIGRLPHRSLLIGGGNDIELCESIANQSKGRALTLAGKLTLLQSAAIVQNSLGVFANDSAPTHIGTAMNAPTHTVFCSTSPYFGFGPKASESFIHQTTEDLNCRPCGIHGKKKCPEGHFLCSKFQVSNSL